ncbi:glycosyltransferase family 2 protein [Antarctobacter jejuensis]|uniref:glycosyltransferase family 2 protein n=1 Tax=Antarctobacter jejuensis TaxID=1439938 RepID=UPI003FD4DE27
MTLFSTMKNEMGFLPAWLAHHRAIGFEQFLIWDDASDDGSFDYLCDQPDVVVMQSDLSFGAPLQYRDPDGAEREERAGTYMKIALPHLFFDGAFVGYVDADEFLILPPGVGSIKEVVARLEDEGAPSAVASVVEFFPADASGLTGDLPQSFGGLVEAYPYFQAEKLVELVPGKVRPKFCGQSKTATLFERYGITPPLVRRGWHRLWMPAGVKRAQRSQTSPRHKTPLIRRGGGSYQVGSHNGSLPPSSDVLMTVAHFVFTAQSARKTQRAIRVGAHAHGGRKYHGYAALLQAMAEQKNGFLDDRSVRYTGPEQLVALGLMRW